MKPQHTLSYFISSLSPPTNYLEQTPHDSTMISLELHDNPENKSLQDLSLEKRDHIIQLGLFLDKQGIGHLNATYTQEQLRELHGEQHRQLEHQHHALTQSLARKEEELQAVRSDIRGLRRDTQEEMKQQYLRDTATLEQLHTQQLSLARRENQRLQTQMDDLHAKALTQRQDILVEQERIHVARQATQQQLIDTIKSSHQTELDTIQRVHGEKLVILDKQLQDADKWNFVKKAESGNVAKGNQGEAMLIRLLQKNLPEVLHTECRVEDVSKGSGGKGDILIEIPARKVNLIIESKYKTSENVRTKEIERAKRDLLQNGIGATILLAVSIEKPFTGYESRHIEFIQHESKLHIFSLFANLKGCGGNGLALCNWIDLLTRTHVALEPLGGASPHDAAGSLSAVVAQVREGILRNAKLITRTKAHIKAFQEDLVELESNQSLFTEITLLNKD